MYCICDEVKSYLLEPKGIFNWKYPHFPDDLCFFKGGYCWFSTVAHEAYACAYLKSIKDIETFDGLGIEFKVVECNITNEQLFYEDYKYKTDM
jgi:hypothetical protein